VPSVIKLIVVVAVLLAFSPPASAQWATDANTASPAANEEGIVPLNDAERNTSPEPKPALPSAAGRAHFHADPIFDGAVIALSLGFGGVLESINSTGELRPQQISPNFDRSNLLWIDRHSIPEHPSKSAGTLSSAGLGVAIAFGFVDPVLSGFREQSLQTGLVDGVLYAESMSITFAATSMVKLAVRRPRPRAYLDAEAHRGDPHVFELEHRQHTFVLFGARVHDGGSGSDSDVLGVRSLDREDAAMDHPWPRHGADHFRFGRARASRATLPDRRHRRQHRWRRNRHHRSHPSP
jgi:hypothetical protein